MDQTLTVQDHELRYTCDSCGFMVTASSHDPNVTEVIAQHQDSHEQVLDGPRWAHTHTAHDIPIDYPDGGHLLPIGVIVLGTVVAALWVWLLILTIGGLA